MPRSRHDLFTLSLHWLTALLVPLAYLAIQVTEMLPRGALKTQVYTAHQTLGVLVLAVTLVRLAWRPFAPKPSPAEMPGAMRHASTAVHVLMFLGLLAVPVLGMLTQWLRGRGVEMFGLFALAPPFTPDRPMARNLKEAHELLANALMLLALLHALAALFHQYVMRDGLIRRMLPGRDPGRA